MYDFAAGNAVNDTTSTTEIAANSVTVLLEDGTAMVGSGFGARKAVGGGGGFRLVASPEPVRYPGGALEILLVDVGAKDNIVRSLLSRGVSVNRVPWHADLRQHVARSDGIVIGSGPGPLGYDEMGRPDGYLIRRRAIDRDIPLITNFQLARAVVEALRWKNPQDLNVRSWGDFLARDTRLLV